MLNKVLKNFCLLLMLILTSVFFGACCSMSVVADINFVGVDAEFDYASHKKIMDIGSSLEMTLEIPEGFDHEGLRVVLDDEREVPYEVVYDNPNIEEAYRYTVGKTITFEVAKVISDFKLTIDMTKVKRKAFAIKLSSNITSATTTENSSKEKISNIYAVSISPSSINRLLKLDDSNVIAKRLVVDNEVTVYYGEYIALCYEKMNDSKREFEAFYSRPNHFTRPNDILTIGSIKYCQFDVAKSGSMYYHMTTNGALDVRTRLYYIGFIKEGLSIQDKIPEYVAPQGFVLSGEENKFSLLTNRQEYNSDMLSISIYAPTGETYNSEDVSMDKMGGVAVTKYSSAGVFNKRYDRYDMYIGDDIANDDYIPDSSKSSLPNTLYVVVDTSVGNKENFFYYFNVALLHYEKQSSSVPHFVYKTVQTSDKGKLYFCIDLDTVETYIDSKFDLFDGTEYKTGNAIFYIGIAPEYIEDSRRNSAFPYTVINYPIAYDSTVRGVDYNYSFELYILNEDGTKDYGFLDTQGKEMDIVYFLTERLYGENEKTGVQDSYKNNLYFSLTGYDYNGFYIETIKEINIRYKNANIVTSLRVTDPETFNGIESYQIPLGTRTAGDQYQLQIYIDVEDSNASAYAVDFGGLDFNNTLENAIYVTNNLFFTTAEDFVAINMLNKELVNSLNWRDQRIEFGKSKEIYYFVTSDIALDFDIYVNNSSERNDILSQTTQLKDIVGNNVITSLNGRDYMVYVKYQSIDIYGMASPTYYAYNS